MIFIGGLSRPALSEIRLDWGTLRVMGHVVAAFRGGDDHLLSGIGRILERDGFRMVGIRDAAPDLLMPQGVITRAAPDGNAVADIARGLEALAALGPFDIGQAAIVIDRPCGGGRGHRGHRRASGAGSALARGRAYSRQGRTRRAGEGAEERSGFAFRPSDRRSAHHRRCRQRASSPASAIAAGNTIIADGQAMVETADKAGLFVTGLSA